MKHHSITAVLALLLSAAVITPQAFGDNTTTSSNAGANGASDTVANGVPTGTTTTGNTPPSPNTIVAPNSTAAASSGAPYTSPTGVYKGTGSSPQSQATGDVNRSGTASKP